MSRSSRSTLFRSVKAFVLALILALIPPALVEGILVADRNTRATGFPDRRAVFVAQRQEDGGLTIAAFDWSATVSADVMAWWDGGIVTVQTILPHTVKAGAAVIERIIDLCFPPADPED